jgi:hypothetical protein
MHVQAVVEVLGMVMLVQVGIIIVMGLTWIIGLQCAAINRLRRWDDDPAPGPFQAFNGKVDRAREWDHR